MLLPPHVASAVSVLALFAASSWISFSKRTPKALGFAVLTLAGFLVQTADGLFLSGAYGGDLAFETTRFLAGDWWRAFSYLFVHAGLFHIVGNLFLLATAGPLLEDRIGGRAWTLLYLGGGALSVASHMLIYPGGGVLAVGASGAIFGVLGALAIVAPQARVPVPLFFIFWFPAWVAVLIFAAFNVVYALSGSTGVAWYGHFAGLVIGIAAGVVLARRPAVAGPRAAKLPATAALEPLATTPRLRTYLERLRAIRGETPDDAAYAQAWLDRFLAEATCPECSTRGLRTEGREVRCPRGHVVAPPPP